MKRLSVYARVLVSMACVAGCAVQQHPGSRVVVNIDQADLFGKQIEAFVLPDGTEASLRELERGYSLKLRTYSRVVDIERATALQFRSAQDIDGYTLIVLDKSEKNCAVKTHLVAVKGTEVRQWDFGDCSTVPGTAMVAEGMRFDLQKGSRTTRYLFSQGRLTFGDVVAPTPLMVAPAPATRPAPAARPPIPGVPAAAQAVAPAQSQPEFIAAARDAAESRPAPPVTGADKRKQPRARKALPAPSLTFGAKEQVPHTIYLDH